MSSGEQDIADEAPYFPVVDRIRRDVVSCSEALDADDFKRSDDAVDDLVGLLRALKEATELEVEAALVAILDFLSSPDSNPMAREVVALAVPTVVTMLSTPSDRCLEVAESVMESIVSVCSPRDLLPIFCEALISLLKEHAAAFYVGFLLGGLKRIISCIKRQLVQQLKMAVPVVIKALHAVILDWDNEQEDAISKLFNEASDIVISIEKACQNVNATEIKQTLHSILGLYMLQITALLTKSILAHKMPHCIRIMLKLYGFFSVCQCSCIGLITGSTVEAMIANIPEEEDDNFIECFSLVNDGASLAVIWGCISGESFDSSGDLIASMFSDLKASQVKRWQAMRMLRPILSSADYPWWIKSHAVDLLLSMMDAKNSIEINDSHLDDFTITASSFLCLQAIQKTIIYAPDSNLRKKAFSALKNVLSDLPYSQQYNTLKALITNNDSPSMIGILVDIIKDKFLTEFRQRIEENYSMGSSSFWGPSALDVIESILKPPKGGPPSLPEQTEPVLSALNLYRFILLTEASGKTNYSRALSEKSLKKAYNEWLLPLKAIVSRIEAENMEVRNDITEITLCSLNPVQLVLHRCIELVEDFLEQSKATRESLEGV